MTFTEEQVAEAMEGLPALWVLKHHIKTETGFPIEFEKRKFLWDMYNDLSPKQVEMKPPQIGLTVKAIVKTFWVGKKLRRDIIYTLPTQGDVEDMASDKINRIVAQNPILQQWVREHDTVVQKTVGNNIIHYRGTFTSKQAMMVSSGLNVHDEVDASDPAVINQYETRLEGQENEDMKWRWYFSHPSLAGHGVDIYWQQSDQKEWYITCNDCSEEQTLTWPQSISMEQQTYVCKQCSHDLPDEVRINGRWLDKDGRAWDGVLSPGYIFSGWHVSQLMLWNKTAADIIRSFNDPTKDSQYFWNYVLGLPYVSSDDRIDPSVVLRNCVDKVNPRETRTIIGVDTGDDYISYVLMNKEGVFYYDTEKGITASKNPYDVLRKHLNRFPKSIVVIDQGGELMNTRQLQAEYPGRVFLVFYNKDKKTVDLVDWGEDEEYWKVRVDRNRMMTLMVEQLRDVGRIRLNGTKEEWAEFASHFGYIYREKIVVKETRGKDNRELYGAEYVWKRSGPDHYCFIAGTQITTNVGNKAIENVQVGDMVLTRKGFKKVYDAGLKRAKERVTTAYFSNGSSFTATPDHPLINSLGKERLDSTTRHAILYSCKNQRVSYTKGLLTDATRNLQGESQEFTLSPMGLLGQKGLKGFISRYGLMPMAQFLKGLSFIIETKIRLITTYLTWCAKVESTIKVTTKPVGLNQLLTEHATKNTSPIYDHFHTSGGVLKQEKSGIAYTLIRLSFWLFPKYLHVLSAALKVLHAATRGVSSVAPDVVIVGLHENIVRKDVINVSVEDEHEYFANGILVSNCHALLYGMVGLQRYGGEAAKIVGDSALAGLPVGKIATPGPAETIVAAVGPGDFHVDNRVQF